MTLIQNDIERAFQAARTARAGAVQIGASPLLFAYTKTIIGLAAKHQIPAIYEWREAVEAGGFASYGPVLSEMWRHTALTVGKIRSSSSRALPFPAYPRGAPAPHHADAPVGR